MVYELGRKELNDRTKVIKEGKWKDVTIDNYYV